MSTNPQVCQLNESLCQYYDENRAKFKKASKRIANVIRYLKKNRFPVHAFKTRTKSFDSAFLKLKKDQIRFEKEKGRPIEPQDIEDYVGIRILSLLEEEIILIHRAIMKVLPEKNYRIKEIRIYGWTDSSASKYTYQHILREIENNRTIPDIGTMLITMSQKLSGYSCIHYEIEDALLSVPVEIQVRTMFQDIWGELEHVFVYKKREIHPQIKKTFNILSEELRAKDAMLSHLRDVVKNEEHRHEYANKTAAPRGYLIPDKDFQGILKKIERPETAIWKSLASTYQEYLKHVSSQLRIDRKDTKWAENAKKVLDALRGIARKLAKAGEDEKILEELMYFINFESVYLEFGLGKYAKAYRQYYNINKKYDKSYVTFFRSGEIALLNGDTATALVWFDLCESTLKGNSKANILNKFRIYMFLAHIYVYLSADYIDNSLVCIEKAKEVYISLKKNLDSKKSNDINSLTTDDVMQLHNYLCWIHLMMYIYKGRSAVRGVIKGYVKNGKFEVSVANSPDVRDDAVKEKVMISNDLYKKAEKYFEQLKQITRQHPQNMFSNIYDTLAWFCYHSYSKENDDLNILLKSSKRDIESINAHTEKKKEWIRQAMQYSVKIEESRDYSPYNMISMNIHINHIQEIQAAYRKEFPDSNERIRTGLNDIKKIKKM